MTTEPTETERQLRHNVESVRDELLAVERLATWYDEHVGDSAEDVAREMAEYFAGDEVTDEDRESLRVLLEDLDTVCDLDPTIPAALKTVGLAADAFRALEGASDDEDAGTLLRLEEEAGAAEKTLAEMLEGALERLEEHGGPAGVWIEGQLEVYADGRYSLAAPGWTITEWGVLCAFGGPNVRVAFRGSGDFTVTGYWGGDKAEAWGSCETVGAYLANVGDAFPIETDK